MKDGGMQGMLFGSLTEDDVETSDRPGELRLCALNVNSPSPRRAQRILDWLIGAGHNALVLTEMRPTDGCRLLINGLAAQGFEPHLPGGWAGSRHFSLVATRGFDHRAVTEPFDPRAVAVDLTGENGRVRVVGLYGPTNGMTPDSSDRRRAFHKTFIEFLANIMQPSLVLAGDLNVVEPGHQPNLETFEEHDYEFYRGLLAAGLLDAFRALHPTDVAHSWLNDRFGTQRLDHVFVSPAAGTLTGCHYEHSPRVAHLTDHAAIIASLAWTSPP